MKRRCTSYLRHLPVLLVAGLAAANISAQVSSASIESHIDGLVRDSEKPGTSSSFVRLVEVGKPAIGPLLERLKTTKYCDFQYEVARVIWRIEPKHKILNQLLFDIASAKCEYRYPPERYLPDVNRSSIIAQLYAAKSLAEYQEGGIVLAAKLPERNAVHAFFYAYPAIGTLLLKYERGELPSDPLVIDSLKRAIPHLATRLEGHESRTHCDVWDILTFFQKLKNKELSAAADAALRGKTKVGCDRPAPPAPVTPGLRRKP